MNGGNGNNGNNDSNGNNDDNGNDGKNGKLNVKVTMWNSLYVPEYLVSAPTVNAFKNQIDKLWKDVPFTTDPNSTNIYYTLY